MTDEGGRDGAAAGFSFEGRAVVVTGAATGIGEAAARAFSAGGARVALVDLAESEALAAELRTGGQDALAVRADVTRADQVQAMADACLARFGNVDVLVNCAGGFRRRVPTWELGEDEWDAIVDLNLKSAFLCSRSLLPGMIERGWGRIVNVASGSGRTTTHITSSPYAAAKGGLLAFTRHLAREAAPHGVTVNAVAPGVTLSARIDVLYGAERKEELRAMVPLGRLAQPGDQVGPILFLASEASGYMTGTTLDVNGGRYMF
ncbi:MAG: SDR family NAD(P)-dependent oxidoreductase [Candidatus Dormibacterales bacterium]